MYSCQHANKLFSLSPPPICVWPSLCKAASAAQQQIDLEGVSNLLIPTEKLRKKYYGQKFQASKEEIHVDQIFSKEMEPKTFMASLHALVYRKIL
jgi:hypothetical protein